MINNLLIQLIIEKEREKKLLIKNTSFRVMKHTTLLSSVYFPSTLVLTFSSWRVRRRCPASLSHLFGRRAASSFTIHPSMRMMKMQSKNRKKRSQRAQEMEQEKKVRNYRRHWDVISSILLLSFSPFCLSFLHVIPSTIYTWTTSRSETAGNNNMSEQWMSMVNVSAAAAKERTFQPSNSRPRVYFFTPNFAQVL